MSTTSLITTRRMYTPSGSKAYDMLEWKKRDAVIANPMTGEAVFEQKNVEFPSNFSQNAINIVAQKYFCGTPGAKERESSLRELIDRVVDTTVRHGEQEGYFESETEATDFKEELKYVLATQRAAFNSPVWFNIGAPERSQQASACFILAVEDTMPSILNWYTEEGMIFKGGSGSGLNISSIRSSHEPLGKSAGTASGPLSFMRGADASAGAIKSGGKTRRAAKMVILNVDHPDIEEFIWSKAIEERKSRVLQENGFDMDLNGKDSFSVQYQNANNSVRVTDEFMQAVNEDADWDLVGVKTGKVYKTLKARELWRQIAASAYECADPGLQFDTTINDWHTTPKAGRINGSNPCSEYMHLDNSACNLASINLLKFLDEDGSFNVVEFKHTVELVLTAQEILVGYSAYPTESIGKNAKAYRELGIGYANLGALLMAQGLPYDSEEGRAQAAAITALLTGHSYATSAKIAKRVGPFEGFHKDREGVLRVLKKHRAAVKAINPTLVSEELLSAAAQSWDEANELGERYGVRNSQVSVLAPTGTIAFLMDCDTTGVEPDFSLTKHKKLVGGGDMVIVNQTIPYALKTLGYSKEEAKDIVEYIHENGNVIDAPHLKKQDYDVFACAVGENSIHYMGHVKMMGAIQPFLSGAISKTVNMPESATIDDVADLHYESWKLGLKAVAIYRDGSKVAQPLSSNKKEKESQPATTDDKAEDLVKIDALPTTPTTPGDKIQIKGAVRRLLPKVRNSKTYKFRVADLTGFFTVGEYDDGTPGELFVSVSKQGSTLSGLMDAFSRSVSHGLQYGVPLKSYVESLMTSNFPPFGITDDPEIQRATSMIDYIFRRLALDYLSFDDRLELGLASIDDMQVDQQSFLDEETIEPEPSHHEAQREEPADFQSDHIAQATSNESSKVDDSPMCFSCGNRTQRSGSCYVCTSCGSTTGCS